MIQEKQIINGHEVLRFTHKIGKSKYADCKCGSCGEITNRRANTLRLSKSCRRCSSKTNSNNSCWKGFGEITHDLYTTYKHSAKAKNLEFKVSIEYLWKLFIKQERKCSFTGEELYFNKTYKNKSDRTASPDRIDSSKGYIEGNIQWVHRDVNKLKKNFSDERFLEICEKIIKYKNKC